MAVMWLTSVVEMFKGTMCSGVLACGEDLRGTMKCHTVGRPADRAVQRTDSLSQSTLPKRNVGASGRVESEERIGTDSYNSMLAVIQCGQSSSSCSCIELERTFHFASIVPHRPKQVLFPPVK